MIIMKFGGTSVTDCEAITRTISIVVSKLDQQPVVVVSALSGVTDLLYKIADAAKEGDFALSRQHIATIKERHLHLADGLMPNSDYGKKAKDKVMRICDEMQSFVDAICAVGELTPRSKAKIISNGELLSSSVIYFAMEAKGIPTGFVDARTMIITKGDYMKGEPIIPLIENRVPEEVQKAYAGKQAVITQGFISSTESGEPSVLGRGGSDYTASLIGMALNAKAIEIWTDVDGVKTADPRRVANTKSIEKISFEEAAEMAHFGAKVLHPLTIEPAVMKDIPVYVLNSYNPDGARTEILKNELIADGVKSVSFKEKILMMNIFSTKMIDVPGFLSRVFKIFADNQVSVDLISTSEANISLTLDDSPNLEKVVQQLSEFANVRIADDKSQVSIIGKNVVHQRGLMRWAKTAFNNTAIYMISQGASFVNISYVVDRKDLDEVLQELHCYLFEY